MATNRRRLALLVTALALALVVVLASAAAWGLYRSADNSSTAKRRFAHSLAATMETGSPPASAVVSDTAEGPAAGESPELSAARPLAITPVPAPAPVAAVDIDRVMRHIASLQALGVRARGSDAERSAAEYVRLQLAAMGYEPRIEEFPLTEGTRSSNVIATASGTDPRVIVLGAHMDSKSPSPGANDNGTGCALLLELARVFRNRPHAPTIEFVFFGAEESRGDPEDHHVGSAYRVASLSPAEKARIAGMISVDMIGVGTRFHARTMGLAPSTMSDAVLAEARRQDIRMSYLADPGRSGWSDHGPFELAGIPAVWIEWRDDSAYHTARDTSGRLSRTHLQQAGELLGGLLGRLDGNGLDALAR